MRFSLILAASAASALALSACASSGPPADAPVVDIDSMQDMLGRENEPFVIRISKGTRLPVVAELAAPFAHSESDGPALHIVFDRTVYWFPRTPDRVSFDGESWEAINDAHAGQLSFGLGKSEQHGAHATVRVALTPRGK